MNGSQFSELISAYLDGEVTVEERALVEKTLVENSTLRRLFYDFRALRALLAQLPKYQVRADLSKEILRLAEQDVVLPKVKSVRPVNTKPSARRPAVVVLKRSWYPAGLWMGGAVAALLMFALLGRWRNNPGEEIAQGPKGEITRDNAVPAPKAPHPNIVVLDGAEAGGMSDIRPSAASSKSNAREGIAEGDRKQFVPAPAPPSGYPSVRATRPAEETSPISAKPGVATMANSARKDLGNSTLRSVEPPAALAVDQPKAKLGDDAANLALRQGQQIRGGTLTVVCDVSGPRFEEVLRRSFARSNIAWNEQGKSQSSSVEKEKTAQEPINEKSIAASNGGTGPRPIDVAKDQDAAHDSSGGNATFRAANETLARSPGVTPAADGETPTALIYVEASPDQIQQVLRELREDREVFLATDIPLPTQADPRGRKQNLKDEATRNKVSPESPNEQPGGSATEENSRKLAENLGEHGNRKFDDRPVDKATVAPEMKKLEADTFAAKRPAIPSSPAAAGQIDAKQAEGKRSGDEQAGAARLGSKAIGDVAVMDDTKEPAKNGPQPSDPRPVGTARRLDFGDVRAEGLAKKIEALEAGKKESLAKRDGLHREDRFGERQLEEERAAVRDSSDTAQAPVPPSLVRMLLVIRLPQTPQPSNPIVPPTNVPADATLIDKKK